MLEICPLQLEDLAQAFVIEEQAHQVPWSFATLQTCQGVNYLNLALWKNGKFSQNSEGIYRREMLGFAICQQVADEATLFNLAINPAHQGQGLGKILLENLIAQLKGNGLQTLWLEVRVSNTPAIGLYEKLGFKLQGKRKNYYATNTNQRENALVMSLNLG